MYAIGALARETGVKIPTIRYYEQIGLIAPPARTAGNQRRYQPKTLLRLRFIRHARDLGFSLDAIERLLSLAAEPRRSCKEIDEIARRNLGDIEERIRRLEGLEAALRSMIRQCSGGHVCECRVIEVLADHSQCLADH